MEELPSGSKLQCENSENNFILQREVDSWSAKEESVGMRFAFLTKLIFVSL